MNMNLITFIAIIIAIIILLYLKIIKKQTKLSPKEIFILTIILAFTIIPYESFISFKNVKSGFKFFNVGTKIVDTIEYENHVVIIYKFRHHLEFDDYEKNNNRFKKATTRSWKKLFEKVDNLNCNISTIIVDKTEEVFIVDCNSNDYKVSYVDGRLMDNYKIGRKKVYYGSIQKDGYIQINDEKISLKLKKL